ncbi:MAG TPA: capsule assembly Wzi family protein [Treponemataceae bacterium]|jgi:hypothetical protein|nr:capsule assembly Wzi family protein [Treponemataceae bacterium]
MKRAHRHLFAGCLALALPFAAGAEPDAGNRPAEILSTRRSSLEWAYLERIASGSIPPTTVQSISDREARYYGLEPAPARKPTRKEIERAARAAEEARAAEAADSNAAVEGSGANPAATKEPRARVRPLLSLQPFAMAWHGLDVSRRMKDASLLARFRLDEPALVAGVAFSSASFYGRFQLDFVTDSIAKYADEDGVTGIWDPKATVNYWTFPDLAYLSYSGENLTIAAGRLPSGIGLGDSNLFLNGQARWYDQLQFSWWSEHFRFFALWGTSSSHLSEEEYNVQFYTTKAPGDEDSWGWDILNNHDAATQAMIPAKFFTYHRIEVKPFRWIGFGLGEMQLVGGKAPDLTNLLPTVLWHNTYTAGLTNVMLHVDVWSVPYPGVLLYGEFLMDDSKSPSEDRAAKPNCWAWELGARWVIPARPAGMRIALRAEYSHVDEWTYNRWQPYLTMYQRQMITGGWTGFDIPLGHPEGGDVDVFSLSALALARDGRRVEVGVSYVIKGPVYLGMIDENGVPIYYDYDEWAAPGDSLDEVTGKPDIHRTILSAKASWPITGSIEISGGIDVRFVRNAGHESGERAVEGIYKIAARWSYR